MKNQFWGRLVYIITFWGTKLKDMHEIDVKVVVFLKVYRTR